MDAYEIILHGSLPDQMLCRMLEYPAASMSRCMPPANARFECGWCRCVGVLLSLSLFSPFQFQCFFVLAVVQGHYVMLTRAPHLEKCH